jgi:hypothetical protein
MQRAESIGMASTIPMLARRARPLTVLLPTGLFALAMACGTPPTTTLGAPCSATHSAFQGVTATLSASTCTYRVGQAGTFEYSVTVDEHAAPFTLPASGPSGGPDPTDGKLATLVDWRIVSVSGEAEGYCGDCDLGLGPGWAAATLTLEHGTKSATLSWPGRTWFGPSDTNNPLGPAFTVGDYEVTLVVRGTNVVLAKLPIQVVN